MKSLILFMFILFNCELTLAGSDAIVAFKLIPVDVLQHSSAQNSVETFNNNINNTLNEVIEKFNQIIENKTLSSEEAILQVENVRDQAEIHVNDLLNQLLVYLSGIIQVNFGTFKEAISSNQTLPEDISKIIEFGRVSIFKADAINEAITGRAYEFVFKFLNKV
ncbi:hypothetical protein PVAND_015887 [Polypedilum vanderplanki]|uniref:Uncharacterized protein n=1 Tax=Polypedilum vanderplanki TaxID=319348 RepID=A0A9J6BDY3_POLVA|nr:hypothetical protein PVAND_015887 [Polypedilum vanderplanki]